jgi:hypothetical protein
MNDTVLLPQIATVATAFCHAYGEALYAVGRQSPAANAFGYFMPAYQAVQYEVITTYVLWLSLAIILFVETLDFVPYGDRTGKFFTYVRFIETVFLLLFPILDAILVFVLYGVRPYMMNNLTAWYRLAINLLLIDSSIAQAVLIHTNRRWLERLVDFNWQLVGVLLILQFEGTWGAALLRAIAGTLLIGSTVFSVAANRYLDFRPAKTVAEHGATSVLYLFQLAAAILMCVSVTSEPPLHLLLQNVKSSSFSVWLYILFALISLEFLVCCISGLQYNLTHVTTKELQAPRPKQSRTTVHHLSSSSSVKMGIHSI